MGIIPRANRVARQTVRLFVAVALSVAVLLAGAAPASAHDTSPGATVLTIDDQRIVVTARVPFEELGYSDTTGDDKVGIGELRDQGPTLATSLVETVRDHSTVTIDGTDVMIIAAGVPLPSTDDDYGPASKFVSFVFMTGPHDGDVNEVSLDWKFNSQSTEVVLSHADGAVVGDLGDDGSVSFSLEAWASAVSFFKLGIEHIQFGPDHLLFLVVLTLTVSGTAVNRKSTWSTVKLVTAFTIGHGISLCLAYFNLVSIPAGIVEPAIALSIVAAAALALRGRSDDAHPWIAGVVGLIHGLGFAATLGSLGIATSHRAPALAAFNLGIDVAQTVVVLVVTAGLWAASKLLSGRLVFVRVPVAAFAGLVGLAWTVARIT